MNKMRRGFSFNHPVDQLESRLCLSTSSTTSTSDNSIGTPIAVADFNGDGNMDLLVRQTAVYSLASRANSSRGMKVFGRVTTLNILPGNGDGTFSEAMETGITAKNFSVTDFNGDGKADLLTLDRTGLYAVLGNGDGTFAAGVKIKKVPSGTLYLADLNGDKNADILVQGRSSVSLLAGNGDGTFAAATAVTIDSGFKVAKVADFTGDGNNDILLKNATDGTVSVLAGNGDGTFATATAAVEISGDILTAADFNGDGVADLLVKDVSTYTLDSGNSAGTGSFGFGFMGGWGGGFGFGHHRQIVITYNILLGNGDGTFQEPIDTGLTQAPNFVADINSDKMADLIFAGNYSTAPIYRLGIGDGTFADGVEITITPSDSTDVIGVSENPAKNITTVSTKKSASAVQKKTKSGKHIASHKKAFA